MADVHQPDRDLKCPCCGLPMRPGLVANHARGLFIFQFGRQHLFFQWQDDASKRGGFHEVKVVDAGLSVKAFRCEGCGTAVIPRAT